MTRTPSGRTDTDRLARILKRTILYVIGLLLCSTSSLYYTRVSAAVDAPWNPTVWEWYTQPSEASVIMPMPGNSNVEHQLQNQGCWRMPSLGPLMINGTDVSKRDLTVVPRVPTVHQYSLGSFVASCVSNAVVNEQQYDRAPLEPFLIGMQVNPDGTPGCFVLPIRISGVATTRFDINGASDDCRTLCEHPPICLEWFQLPPSTDPKQPTRECIRVMECGGLESMHVWRLFDANALHDGTAATEPRWRAAPPAYQPPASSWLSTGKIILICLMVAVGGVVVGLCCFVCVKHQSSGAYRTVPRQQALSHVEISRPHDHLSPPPVELDLRSLEVGRPFARDEGEWANFVDAQQKLKNPPAPKPKKAKKKRGGVKFNPAAFLNHDPAVGNEDWVAHDGVWVELPPLAGGAHHVAALPPPPGEGEDFEDQIEGVPSHRPLDISVARFQPVSGHAPPGDVPGELSEEEDFEDNFVSAQVHPLPSPSSPRGIPEVDVPGGVAIMSEISLEQPVVRDGDEEKSDNECVSPVAPPGEPQTASSSSAGATIVSISEAESSPPLDEGDDDFVVHYTEPPHHVEHEAEVEVFTTPHNN